MDDLFWEFQLFSKKMGITGGAGYAYVWEGDTRNENEWRDTMYRLEGPIVTQLQRVFTENWKELTGEELSGESYFPQARRAGSTRALVVKDSAAQRSQPLAHGVLQAINSSQKELLLEQSYFIPDERFRAALIAAEKRGVDVQIIMADAKIDSQQSRFASQNHWKELLEGGVRLFEYKPSMMHNKLIVADGRYAIVGSGNLDPRSFFINDEANLHVMDVGFAREQRAMFFQDRARCAEVTLETLPQTLAPGWKRFVARVLEPQL